MKQVRILLKNASFHSLTNQVTPHDDAGNYYRSRSLSLFREISNYMEEEISSPGNFTHPITCEGFLFRRLYFFLRVIEKGKCTHFKTREDGTWFYVRLSLVCLCESRTIKKYLKGVIGDE